MTIALPSAVRIVEVGPRNGLYKQAGPVRPLGCHRKAAIACQDASSMPPFLNLPA